MNTVENIKMTKNGDIPKEIRNGRLYHCSWAKKKGFVWKLISHDEEKDEALMETPKSKKRMVTQLSSLRNVNKNIGK